MQFTFLKSLLIFLISGALFMQCESPYQFDAKSQQYYVIDAHISNLKSSVQITYSTDFNNYKDSPKPYKNAVVSVVDSIGNEVPFYSQGNGLYFPLDTFHAQLGQKYKAIIDIEGLAIASDFERVQEPVPFSIETAIVTREEYYTTGEYHPVKGLLVSSLSDSTTETRYLRWKCDEQFLDFKDIPARKYYNDAFRMSVTKSHMQDHVELYYKRAFEVAPNSNSASTFTVTQESLTQEAYQYWMLIREQISNTGSIFDTMPAQVSSNFHCTSDESQTILGYFYATYTTKEAIYIRHQ